MPTLQPGSREYILIPITADGAPAGTYSTEITLATDGVTLDPDTATWYPCDQADEGTVQVLIGQGGTIEPEPGTYDMYTRTTAPPELPILPAGPITIL